METEISIADAPERSRYEARDAGGNLMGLVKYKLDGPVIAFLHAETLPEFRGRGVAGQIAAKSLEDAREAGLRVRPDCPFYQQYLADHPEYADLVDQAGQ